MRSDRMPYGAWRLRMVEDKLESWRYALERGMKVNRRKTACMCVRACLRACVLACVRECVRACVRARVRACVRVCVCEREAESKSE